MMDNIHTERTFFSNGKIKELLYFKNHKLDYNEKPAYTSFYYNGIIRTEMWYRNDELHRDDGPAQCFYNENGDILRCVWWCNGQVFRNNNNPSVIEYSDDRTTIREEWIKNACHYNDIGPIIKEYYCNGEEKNISHIIWNINPLINKKILQWLYDNNIELSENCDIMKLSDRILYKLVWGINEL